MKTLKFIINKIKCNLTSSYIYDYNCNNKQLYHLVITYKNCIKIYVNDVLVPKQNTFVIGSFKETNSIKIKLIGIFNNQTYFLKVEANKIEVNLPFFEKSNKLNSIRPTNTISHKSFNLTSQTLQIELDHYKPLKMASLVKISKELKLNSTLINQNYNLTKITNIYGQ
jgi:hypothetical protein